MELRGAGSARARVLLSGLGILVRWNAPLMFSCFAAAAEVIAVPALAVVDEAAEWF